jgi:hypothetical protein
MTTDGLPYTLQVGAPSAAILRFSAEHAVLVSAGQEEVVRELVGAGADVNGKNDKGITPLFVSRAPCRAAVFSPVMGLF